MAKRELVIYILTDQYGAKLCNSSGVPIRNKTDYPRITEGDVVEVTVRPIHNSTTTAWLYTELDAFATFKFGVDNDFSHDDTLPILTTTGFTKTQYDTDKGELSCDIDATAAEVTTMLNSESEQDCYAEWQLLSGTDIYHSYRIPIIVQASVIGAATEGPDPEESYLTEANGYRGKVAATPGDATEGDMWYDTVLKAFRGKNDSGVGTIQIVMD